MIMSLRAMENDPKLSLRGIAKIYNVPLITLSRLINALANPHKAIFQSIRANLQIWMRKQLFNI